MSDTVAISKEELKKPRSYLSLQRKIGASPSQDSIDRWEKQLCLKKGFLINYWNKQEVKNNGK